MIFLLLLFNSHSPFAIPHFPFRIPHLDLCLRGCESGIRDGILNTSVVLETHRYILTARRR